MRRAILERDVEVSAMERSVRALTAGESGIVVVEAESGLGKTTLLRYAGDLASAAGVTVLAARGAELENDCAFGVVRQLFEPFVPQDDQSRRRLFAGNAAEARVLFTEPPASTAAASAERPSSLYAVLNGLYKMVARLVARGPLLLLVDDLQWSDTPSLRFLGFLSRRLDTLAVTIVVANRPGEGNADLVDDLMAAPDVTLVEPRALSAAAVTQLVREALGPQADPGFCATCHAVTNGNPVVVHELLRILVAERTRPDAAAAVAVEAAGPGALRRHILGRLRRQTEDVQAVARAVAVLGDGTDLAVVARYADVPLPAAADGAEQLTRCGILDRADPPVFVHAIVRDVVLSVIPLAEHSAVHERAAVILREMGFGPVRIASHLLRSRPDDNPDTVEVLLAAAAEARRQGSPGSAATYLARARAEPPPVAMRSEVARLLGNCQIHEPKPAEADKHLREALALAQTPEQRAWCAYSLARFSNACGSTSEAIALLAQAVRDLSGDGHPELVTLLETELVGFARIDVVGRPYLLEHLASLRSRPRPPTAVVQAQLSLEALFGGAPVDEAVRLARQALLGAELVPDRSAVWAAVHALILADHLAESERRLQRALDTTVHRGLQVPMALAHGYLARVGYLRGDLVAAADHVHQGMDAVAGPNFAVPVLQATQVDLLVEGGRLAEADAIVSGSVLGAAGEPDTIMQFWLLGARMRLRAAQERHMATLSDGAVFERLYSQWGAGRIVDVPWRLYAAHAHHQLGQRDRATHLLTEHTRLARSFAVPRHIATALRATAALTPDVTESRRLLEQSVELLESSPARLELAVTLEQLGLACRDGGDQPAAQRSWTRATELAADCAATALSARLGSMRAGNGTNLEGLFTPTEWQVAELAVNGLTNREIARKLFLSTKTVEAHLSRAYRKLGVRSRTQLAARIATR